VTCEAYEEEEERNGEEMAMILTSGVKETLIAAKVKNMAAAALRRLSRRS